MHLMIYNQLVWYWDKDMAYTDQKVSPTNINYTSKDFSSLKADLIQYTKAYFPDTAGELLEIKLVSFPIPSTFQIMRPFSASIAHAFESPLTK